MFYKFNPVFWLIGILAFLILFQLARRHFSTEARDRRRRDRSHGPVVSRKRGPSVRLAVDVGKSKRKTKN